MAATVDDLIATISSGVHVGQEGYDLRALQAHLAQTLYHPTTNPSNPGSGIGPRPPAYQHQPIIGSSTIPPVPVSSLTSQLSDGEYGYPGSNGVNHISDLVAGGKTQRPQVTPMSSFRGFSVGGDVNMDMDQGGAAGGGGDLDMDMDMDEEEEGQELGLAFNTGSSSFVGEDTTTSSSTNRRRKRYDSFTSPRPTHLPSPPVDGFEDEISYSAFDTDAFAPLCAPQRYDIDEEVSPDGGDQTPKPIPRSKSAGNGWEAFQKRSHGATTGGGWERYGFNLQPIARDISGQGEEETRFGSADTAHSASSSTFHDDHLHHHHHPASQSPPTGLPTPPEENPIPRPRSSPQVVGNAMTHSTRSSPGVGSGNGRIGKRKSGMDEQERKKWEGRLRSAAMQAGKEGIGMWDVR